MIAFIKNRHLRRANLQVCPTPRNDCWICVDKFVFSNQQHINLNSLFYKYHYLYLGGTGILPVQVENLNLLQGKGSWGFWHRRVRRLEPGNERTSSHCRFNNGKAEALPYVQLQNTYLTLPRPEPGRHTSRVFSLPDTAFHPPALHMGGDVNCNLNS